MKRDRLAFLAFACAVSAGLSISGPAWACNVPVYRYALERWSPDAFEVTLYGRGPLPAAEQAVVAALREASDQGTVNFNLKVVDLPGPTNFPLPWLTVEYPDGKPAEMPIAWQGRFASETGRLLLDSPVRRELVKRLVKGDAIVWVLLDADPAAERLLGAELRRLEKEIALPEVDPDDPRTEGNRALKLSFSVLPVTRADPAERILVSLLLGTASALTNATGSVAFAVFGRGRVLPALTGKDLNAASIAGVAQYLCGACSCEIKEQNPGVDLLLAADWDGSVQDRVVRDPPLPQLVSLSTLVAPPAPLSPARAAAPAPVPTGALGRNLLVALVLVFAAAVIGTLLVKRGRRP